MKKPLLILALASLPLVGQITPWQSGHIITTTDLGQAFNLDQQQNPPSLAADIASGATSFTLNRNPGWTGPVWVRMGDEIKHCLTVVGAAVSSCTANAEGSTAGAHTQGTYVVSVPTAAGYNGMVSAIIQLETYATRFASPCPDTGAVNTITCTTSIGFPVAAQQWEVLWVVMNHTNTGAVTITVTPNGGSTRVVKNVTKDSNSGPVALTGNELHIGSLYFFTFDGTNYQVALTGGGTGSGNATQIQSRNVTATTPTDGQLLCWSLSNAQYQFCNAGVATAAGSTNAIQYNSSAVLAGVTPNATATRKFLVQSSASGGAPLLDILAVGDIPALPWSQITSGVPTSFTPSAHASTHAAAGADPVTLTESQTTNLVTDLAAKAPLASPTLTGTPTAPTALQGDGTTKLATTAYVDTGLATKPTCALVTTVGTPGLDTNCASEKAIRTAIGAGGGGGGSGNMTITTGTGNPSGACTPGVTWYLDTTPTPRNLWFCDTSGSWDLALSTTNTGPSRITFTEGTAPGNPGSGQRTTYTDSADHHFKIKDSSGTVVDLDAGGGGGAALSYYIPLPLCATNGGSPPSAQAVFVWASLNTAFTASTAQSPNAPCILTFGGTSTSDGMTSIGLTMPPSVTQADVRFGYFLASHSGSISIDAYVGCLPPGATYGSTNYTYNTTIYTSATLSSADNIENTAHILNVGLPTACTSNVDAPMTIKLQVHSALSGGQIYFTSISAILH